MQSMYPFSRLSDAANVLIMPNLAAANSGSYWRNTPMADDFTVLQGFEQTVPDRFPVRERSRCRQQRCDCRHSAELRLR